MINIYRVVNRKRFKILRANRVFTGLIKVSRATASELYNRTVEAHLTEFTIKVSATTKSDNSPGGFTQLRQSVNKIK